LWAFAWGKHKEAADFFMNLFNSPIPLNYIGPISEYITQTKNETLLVKVGRNYPDLNRSFRWPLMSAMIRTADTRHVDIMIAALKSADKEEKEEAGRLATWFERYPNDEATVIIRDFVGKDYQAESDLTFSLAGLGDVETINWARDIMNTSDKDRWMAYYAIAHSPIDEADKLAKGVIAGNNPENLVWLIQGYKDSLNPNRFNRLRDVVNLSNKDTKVTYWLNTTLKKMAEDGNTDAVGLLKTLEN